MTRQHAITSNADVTYALEVAPLDATADGLPMLCLEHDLVVPGGVLRLYEHVSREAWTREPRRAALLLPGPIATAAFYRIPVAGFDAATELLRAGFLCLTVDLLGTGQSSRPPDGRTATLAVQVAAVGQALRQYCSVRGIPSVDVVGESWGGAIAAQLAAGASHVRSAVLVSTLYRTSTPALEATARDPRWRGMLEALPDGYLPIGAPIWGPLVARCPRPVADWTLAHQAGVFPAAPMVAVLDLPYFDPSVARVPGLVIHGSEDDRQGREDAADLAAAYGSEGAELVTLEGAGHIPRVEAGARDAFWSTILRFLS